MIVLSKIKESRSFLNMIWLSGDSLIRLGFGFLISVWIARYLGPHYFGVYNYAFSVIAMYASIASLGMNGVVVKELVKHPDKTDVIMGTSFYLQIIGSLLACVFAFWTTFFLRHGEWDILNVVLVMLPSVLLRSSDIIKYWFESNIESKYTVIAQNIAFFLSLLLKISFICFGLSVLFISATVTFEALFLCIILFCIYKRRVRNKKWIWSSSEAKRLLSESWPLILSGVALMLYMRIDQIMIGNMINDSAVGVYSVAVKMAEVWYFVPAAVVSSLFPKIIKEKYLSENNYNKRMQFLYDVLISISFMVAIVVTVFSDFIISFFFGSNYLEASSVIKVYVWGSVFYFLSSASGRWYINEGLQFYALSRNIVGLILAIFLNYLLIPRYGLIGSAYATIVAFSFVAYFFDAFHPKTRIAFIQKTKSLLIFGAVIRIMNTLKKDNP
ncbi:Polysaccharide biosynthesis protein [Klebsiella pneumoniae]|uniref:flippase n=1 Tax=Klebsiella pneumoniae TaxID=573 RepID=UPI000DE7B396|nr:flippase [Klebsiella pneumoniae]SSL01480.1 Polysaccharide biosynthesis protein [Klebsiella pneumoniae]